MSFLYIKKTNRKKKIKKFIYIQHCFRNAIIVAFVKRCYSPTQKQFEGPIATFHKHHYRSFLRGKNPEGPIATFHKCHYRSILSIKKNEFFFFKKSSKFLHIYIYKGPIAVFHKHQKIWFFLSKTIFSRILIDPIYFSINRNLALKIM